MAITETLAAKRVAAVESGVVVASIVFVNRGS